MAHPFVRSALSTLCYVGAGMRPRPGIPVLAYHRITDDMPPGPMAVSPALFARQMAFLRKEKYHVLPLPAYLDYLRKPGSFRPERKVVITFDDGWEDTYTNAFPVLHRFGYSATVFITLGEYPTPGGGSFLTDAQIASMQKAGIIFGAHSMTHPRLGQLSDMEAAKEIAESNWHLRERAGLPRKTPVPFCYPYGSYTDETVMVAREANCLCAFTVRPGRDRPGADLYRLKRTSVNGRDTMFDFKKKLYGSYDLLHTLVQNMRNAGVDG